MPKRTKLVSEVFNYILLIKADNRITKIGFLFYVMVDRCILLTIFGMFCRIIDRVLLKIVGQLASSVEYKPRSHRNSKENLGEEGYFYDYNISAKCLLHIFCYCDFMWSVLQVRLRNWQE